MGIRTKSLVLSGVIALALAGATLVAGSITSNGITLTWPDYPLNGPALISCEPWAEGSGAEKVTLTGLPAGSNVVVNFVFSHPFLGNPTAVQVSYTNVSGTLDVPVPYPMDTGLWPLFDAATNERAIAVAAQARVTSGSTVTKLAGKNWWVRCLPPPPPSEGCTPGYWKQEHHFDSWVPTGLAPGDDFEAVFGVNASFDPHTLLDGLELGGGGEFALARHAVAALLNAYHPDIDYAFTAAQIIAGVQAAYASGDFEPFKDQLDAANNAGCQLN